MLPIYKLQVNCHLQIAWHLTSVTSSCKETDWFPLQGSLLVLEPLKIAACYHHWEYAKCVERNVYFDSLNKHGPPEVMSGQDEDWLL